MMGGYHPDLGAAAHFAMLCKHPAVVGEQHLQRVAHSHDDGHPEPRAEEDATHDVLRLA